MNLRTSDHSGKGKGSLFPFDRWADRGPEVYSDHPQALEEFRGQGELNLPASCPQPPPPHEAERGGSQSCRQLLVLSDLVLPKLVSAGGQSED